MIPIRTKVALIGNGNFGNKIKNCIREFVEFVTPTKADWIIIATPNDLHYEQVKKWLKNKKNVFCEKPLTLTSKTSEELFDLADRMGVKLYVDDVFYWNKKLNFDNKRNLTFNLSKYGSFKANIIDNLAYHHFYLWLENYDFKIKNIHEFKHDVFKIEFSIELVDGRKAKFNYDILSKEYNHNITIDSTKINIFLEKNPLKDMFFSIFENEADFYSNRKRTINATKACEEVKKKIQKKVLVVGGGIFGTTSSVILAHSGYSVTLHEELDDIVQCASNINQYRLHKGYHYPRSVETAKECLDGQSSFKRKYEDSLIDNDIEHYYSISKKDSFINGGQYLNFLEKMNLPFKVIQPTNKGTEITIRADELLFDSDSLRVQAKDKMKSSGVRLFLNKSTSKEDFDDFDYIVIATYAKINDLLDKPKSYQYEVIEKPVVRLPKSYYRKSMVVMDGPFMCFDPFKNDLHVLGHVKHAIHATFIDEYPNELNSFFLENLNKGIVENPKITNIEKFIESGMQFFEKFNELEHVGSMYTIRTVLSNRDHDDARPTIVNQEEKNVFTIFSGKIGTCVESAYNLVRLIKKPLKNNKNEINLL
tara:strand:+ start:2941 stop:4713 length:1773 start_codon:yes stop_codon:yes gene_type:complete